MEAGNRGAPVSARSLEVAFDASGAADAGSRGRVVAVVDVIDAATSAEAALAEGGSASSERPLLELRCRLR